MDGVFANLMLGIQLSNIEMSTLTKRDRHDILWVGLMVLAIGIATGMRPPLKYIQIIVCTGILVLKLRRLFGKTK